MKKIALAAALSLAANTGFAGTLAEPSVSPVVVPQGQVEEASSSAGSGNSIGGSGSSGYVLLATLGTLLIIGAIYAAVDD